MSPKVIELIIKGLIILTMIGILLARHMIIKNKFKK